MHGEAKDGLLSRRIYLQIMADCTHGQPEMPRSLAAESCCCSPLMLVDVSFRFSFRSPSFGERKKEEEEEEERGLDRRNWERAKVNRNGGGQRKKRDGTEIPTTTKRASTDSSTSLLLLLLLSPILVETADDDDHDGSTS